jgi:iron only hydrogenase large subunit-like protein
MPQLSARSASAKAAESGVAAGIIASSNANRNRSAKMKAQTEAQRGGGRYLKQKPLKAMLWRKWRKWRENNGSQWREKMAAAAKAESAGMHGKSALASKSRGEARRNGQKLSNHAGAENGETGACSGAGIEGGGNGWRQRENLGIVNSGRRRHQAAAAPKGGIRRSIENGAIYNILTEKSENEKMKSLEALKKTMKRRKRAKK